MHKVITFIDCSTISNVPPPKPIKSSAMSRDTNIENEEESELYDLGCEKSTFHESPVLSKLIYYSPLKPYCLTFKSYLYSV